MSTRYMKGNRRINQSLKNVAVWGYWVGGGAYAPGTNKENAPWFESLTGTLSISNTFSHASSILLITFLVSADQSGWSWYIPLHNKTVSVGFVMSEDSSISKKKAMNTTHPTSNSVLKDHYVDQIRHAPGLQKLLGNARLLELEEEGGGVKSASDYSYSATSYGGDHFRIVGDAGGKHIILLRSYCTLTPSFDHSTQPSLIRSSPPESTSPSPQPCPLLARLPLLSACILPRASRSDSTTRNSERPTPDSYSSSLARTSKFALSKMLCCKTWMKVISTGLSTPSDQARKPSGILSALSTQSDFKLLLLYNSYSGCWGYSCGGRFADRGRSSEDYRFLCEDLWRRHARSKRRRRSRYRRR